MNVEQILKYLRAHEPDVQTKVRLMVDIIRKFYSIPGDEKGRKIARDIVHPDGQLLLPEANLSSDDQDTRQAALAEIVGQWNRLTAYFADKNNNGKALHITIKQNLEYFILERDVSSRYQFGHCSDKSDTRWGIFKYQAVGPQPHPRGIKKPNIATEVMFICGGFLGSLARACYATYDAGTRNPLDIEEQKALFRKLAQITTLDDKKNIIEQVIKMYTNNQKVSSNSSVKLLGIFHKESETAIDVKWAALKSYMQERDGDYLKNNGKLLFNTIANIVCSENSHSVAMTPSSYRAL